MKEDNIIYIESCNKTIYGNYYLIINISKNKKLKGICKFIPMINDIIFHLMINMIL
jgi:hypothetical protein